MPFKKIDVAQEINKKSADNPEFENAWNTSRNEYELLHDITRKRKEMNLTQKQLAEISNCTQQVLCFTAVFVRLSLGPVLFELHVFPQDLFIFI